MSTLKKKSETCEDQLRRMCKDIAQDITDAKQQDYVDQPRKDITASDWMEGVYNIEWICHQDKSYKAARLLVAGGGPNIWVNLQTDTVDGYWGTDKYSHGFVDNLGLEEICEEIYNG